MVTENQQETSGPEEGLQPDLKSLREARGLTLQDVYETTKISAANLKAMEAEEFHLLPPPIYAKAFLETYAKFLGADEKQILNRYDRYLQEQIPVEKKTRPLPRRGARLPKGVVTAASLAAVFCLFILIYIYANLGTSDVPIVDSVDSLSANPQELGSEFLKNSAPAVREEAPAADHIPGRGPAEGRHQLLIRATEITWLRIKEDFKEPIQVLLKPGEKIESSAKQFAIDIGNAGGIAMEFDGKMMDALGKPGEVIHLKLP